MSKCDFCKKPESETGIHYSDAWGIVACKKCWEEREPKKDAPMTGEQLLCEQRKAVAERSYREARCSHTWRSISELHKLGRKEVLLVCDKCGADKQSMLRC